IIKAVNAPEVAGFITKSAADVFTATPESFVQLIASDSARYGKVVRRLGAKVD
ncbi:MAG: tripartite tricarboxylate transporter substrate binding protein, partial [Burkholderiales bacterium]|nr:tripartite tricarboxylate transporter substrate binding protein [Burkholderiales bacterium]